MSTQTIQVSVPDLCNAQRLQRFIYQNTGTPTAGTVSLHTFQGAATALVFEARITNYVTIGADRSITLTLKRNILPFPVAITSSIVLDADVLLNVDEVATIVLSTVNPGEEVILDITVAGSQDVQSIGLQVHATFYEVLT